jgi:Tyrosine phosphatase family
MITNEKRDLILKGITQFTDSDLSFKEIERFDKTKKNDLIPNFAKNPELISKTIIEILYLYEKASSRSFVGDAFQFYHFFNQMLYLAISLFTIREKPHSCWENPENPLKMLDNDIENKYLENLFPIVGKENPNLNKRNFVDWVVDLFDSLEETYGPSVLPLKLDNIEKYLQGVYFRDYLRNFRHVALTKNLFRSPDPRAYSDEGDFLEEFLIKNEISLIIDLREEETIPVSETFEKIVKKLNITVKIVNFTSLDDGKRIGPGYVKKAELLRHSVKELSLLFLKIEGAMLFHCASGKDRTGIMAALFQLLNGVSNEEITLEYTKSGLDCRPIRIIEVYDFIQKFGGIIKYLESCDLSRDQINAIKEKTCV